MVSSWQFSELHPSVPDGAGGNSGAIGYKLNQCACVNPRAAFLLNMAVKSRLPVSSVYSLKSKVDFSPGRGDVYVFEITQRNW